jgi:hypothetical protein
MQPQIQGKSKLHVIQVTAEQWASSFSEEMHKLVFKELKPAFVDRISYALLIVQAEEVVGYITVRENDHETVYWQFGGVLTRFRRGLLGSKCFEVALEWQKARSKRVLMYTENTNLPMLRLALAYGFLVVGTKTFRQHVMVDLMREFETLPSASESA